MARSKFTPKTRAELIERIRAGASHVDAATAVGVHPDTLKGWLKRGRRELDTAFADFAAQVELAHDAAATEAAGPLTEAEFRQILDRQVRAGSVRALAFWREERDRERQQGKGADGGPFDELMARRHRRDRTPR